MTSADEHEVTDDAAPHAHERRAFSRLSPAALERAAAVFRAAGDPARLRILVRLGEGELCVGELADDSGDDVSTVSQRLRVLRAEALVTRRREGKHVFYSLAEPQVAALIRWIVESAFEPEQRVRANGPAERGGTT